MRRRAWRQRKREEGGEDGAEEVRVVKQKCGWWCQDNGCACLVIW